MNVTNPSVATASSSSTRKVSLCRTSVLFRASHHSADSKSNSRDDAYPSSIRGLRYLEAAHVKDLLAAFRLADNPRDEMAWFRLLQ